LFNVVNPDTFNDDMHVVLLFNVVVPDIFKFAVTFTPDVFHGCHPGGGKRSHYPEKKTL
jgi:hypothetical protein